MDDPRYPAPVSAYGQVLVTAPTEEPVRVDEAKKQLEIAAAITAHDQHLTRLITAARQLCEARINRAFCTQTWDLYQDAFPRGIDASAPLPIKLPKAPLVSVSYVKYYDTAGTLQTLTPTTDYVVLSGREPAEIRPAWGRYWPISRYQAEAVNVRFVAGYGGESAVPENAKLAILMLVSHWFNNREPVLTGTISSTLDFTVNSLLETLSYGDEFQTFGAANGPFDARPYG